MMFTRGFDPGARSVTRGRTPRLSAYSVQSQNIARFAACHWSSSIVRGRKRTSADAFRRDAATDHLGDAPRHHHGGLVGIERRVRAPHRLLGAFTRQALLARGR